MRRVFLLPQAPHIGANGLPPPPEYDSSIPDSAQPEGVVTADEHEAMEARTRQLRDQGVIS